MQTLHEKGIEIASPNPFDRREFAKTELYIPKASKQPRAKSIKDDVIEEKVFDKADEAQSLEDLRQEHEKLKKELGALKNGEDQTKKKKLDEKMKAITEEITQREDQKKEEE